MVTAMVLIGKEKAKVALVAMFMAAPSIAQANDSVAGMALGGLEFMRTDAIEMVSEELHIRPDQVQVRYVFRNVTEKPVETLVAFPLPAVGYPDDFDYVPIPIEDDANYVGFSTRVNGDPITLQMEQRALLMGLDRTERLRSLGVPLIPFDIDAPRRIAALSDGVRATLLREMLISPQYEPRWMLQTVFYRTQVFPAQANVVVEHIYQPVAGGSVLAPVGNWGLPWNSGDPDNEWIDDARERYCVDEATETAMDRQRAGGSDWPEHQFASSDVEYVLTTGANWRGPIGRFRLVVESPGPADFVFVCFDGAERVANNRIEADIEQFWPWHDLTVLFARAVGEGMPGWE